MRAAFCSNISESINVVQHFCKRRGLSVFKNCAFLAWMSFKVDK